VVFDRWSDRYAQRMADVRSSAVRDLFAAATRPDMISFSGGMPEIRRVPIDSVISATTSALRDSGSEALQYGSSEGRPKIRQVVVDLMGEIGVRVKPDDLVITAGAQQALDLIAKIFLDPGDTIITEGPTYLGALQAFSAYQPNVVCIPMDAEGMRTDVLAAELKRLGPRGAKFIYTIPNFQNPAGVTLTPARRRELLDLMLPVALATTSATAVATALLEETRRRRLIVPGASVVEDLTAAALRASWAVA
jgi:2-aminoadipate transaminase